MSGITGLVGLLYCEHGDLLQTCMVRLREIQRERKDLASVAAGPWGPLPETLGPVDSLTRTQKEKGFGSSAAFEELSLGQQAATQSPLQQFYMIFFKKINK